MEKQKKICPYCKCKDQWYMHANGNEEVYQCTDCLRYFKVAAAKGKIGNPAMNNGHFDSKSAAY